MTDATHESMRDRGEVDGHPCLTWPEVRQLREEGTFVFGGHTSHHDRKRFAADPTNEIEACYRDIVTQGGFKPDSFSYAYNEGAGDAALEKVIARIGFTTAVTCTERRARVRRKTNMLQLPRLPVRGGHHSFSATPIAPEGADGQFLFPVSHQGFPLPVTPRFVWSDMAADAGWLPTLEIKSGQTLISSPAAHVPTGMQKAIGFELWDKNPFFRLFV